MQIKWFPPNCKPYISESSINGYLHFTCGYLCAKQSVSTLQHFIKNLYQMLKDKACYYFS